MFRRKLKRKEFENLLTLHFRFLVEEHGFDIQRAKSFEFFKDTGEPISDFFMYAAIKNNVAIFFRMGRGQSVQCSVLMQKEVINKPLTSYAKYRVPLYNIIGRYAPHLRKSFPYKWQQTTKVEKEVKRWAELIKTYCGKILDGDYEEWIRVTT
jgi:hypothetical protein